MPTAKVEVANEIVPLPPAAPTPMEMLNRALNAGLGLDYVRELMELQERFEMRESVRAFEDAMAKAAAEMPVLVKSSTVSFGAGRTSYKHADLAEVVSKVAPVLAKHGLSHRFKTSQHEPGKVEVTCYIVHRLGHSIHNSLTGPFDTSGSKNPIQAMGSTITYLSRYTLMGALGLAAAKDDDGIESGPAVVFEPSLKPDVMRRPDIPAGYPAMPAYEDNADTEKFKEAARNAARQGSAVMSEFWRKTSTLGERKILSDMSAELTKLRGEADAYLKSDEEKDGG